MDNRIPLPTDNIFKFYALFGLLILLFSIGSVIYTTVSTNDFIFNVAVEYEMLGKDPARTPAQEARYKLIEKQLEVRSSDKKFINTALGMFGGLGACLSCYGFFIWHRKLQPLQDEILELTLKKLKQETSQSG